MFTVKKLQAGTVLEKTDKETISTKGVTFGVCNPDGSVYKDPFDHIYHTYKRLRIALLVCRELNEIREKKDTFNSLAKAAAVLIHKY